MKKMFSVHDGTDEQSEWTVGFDLIYLTFYDNLSVHSLFVKLGLWGCLMRMGLTWNKARRHYTCTYIKRLHRHKTRSNGSVRKGINSVIMGNCRLGNGQGRHSLEGSGRGWNPYPGAQTTTGLLAVGDPSPRTSGLFEGCLLLPISSTGALLLDLRPEAGYTFWAVGMNGKHFLVVRLFCFVKRPLILIDAFSDI